MKPEYSVALKKGQLVKHQSFVTERGSYQIALVRYKDCVYFYKYLNGKLTECCNLNKKKGEKEKAV